MTDRHVLIHQSVVTMIDAASKSCASERETGGILMGSVRGPHIECVGFTTAEPLDRRGMSHFTLQDHRHQKAAREAWSKSDRTVTFIGGWHTHPQGAPTPSSIDIASWVKLAWRAMHPMLFLIAAPNDWRGYRMTPENSGGFVRPLDIFERSFIGLVLK